ncbi:hypothetical protein [Lentilitoribacter sp. Alg239-R112]|uniref:hypothetical protein n=1 Tax=Lentilitoribacter sp. Alg239-R112 TaxID=2305987 RepID=UPI0013A6D76F|nr:hypothetical protein [Lentilitoribacter sp. Alg239-R112]
MKTLGLKSKCICCFAFLLTGCDNPKPSYHYEAVLFDRPDFAITANFRPTTDEYLRSKTNARDSIQKQNPGSAQIIEFEIWLNSDVMNKPDKIRIYQVEITDLDKIWSGKPIAEKGVNEVTSSLVDPVRSIAKYANQIMYLPTSIREDILISINVDLILNGDVDTYTIQRRTGLWPTKGLAHTWRRFARIFGIR